jgi:DNA modification methylase
VSEESAVIVIGDVTVHHGNCLDILPTLPDCSVDSVVTDPPYELGFMGKDWDNSGIAYNVTLWSEVLRVLKPGGHLLAFGGTRTYHRMAVAIEDAGFEIRDSIHWMYGSGFPKSLDVSKAIDKAAGAEREVIGNGTSGTTAIWSADGGMGDFNITAPATDAAKQWEGWGTALKPAHEPIVVARRPLIGTVAANVLQHGTGAINIDGTRIEAHDGYEKQWDRPVSTNIGAGGQGNYISDGSQHTIDISGNKPEGGRWPANVIFDPDAATELDRQSGVSKAGAPRSDRGIGGIWAEGNGIPVGPQYGDTGGASRFFYIAKPSKAERTCNGTVTNGHPTLKPLTLMRYLVRLVTPPGGTVLEPFAGSGTTLMAATMEGFNSIGIEMTDDYLPIIEGRVRWAQTQQQELPL